MNDIFKKINTLVNATVNDLLGESASRPKSLTSAHLGKDIDREISALRQKVNEALDYETKLQQQVVALDEEITRWDRQADEAVAQGNDASARYAISQMQNAERRRVMAESDLNEHRLVTQDLMRKVNELEAAVADARQQKPAQPPSTEETTGRSPTRVMSDVLRDTREKISQMGDLISSKEQLSNPPAESPAESSPKAVDDDIDRRRQRLSK